MKSLKLIITVISISLLSTFSLNASEDKPSKTVKELRTQIVSLIGTKIPFEIKKETTANISFIMNKKNEVVILSIDTENNEISPFIKSKLNYKKLKVKGLKNGEIYIIPLKIKVNN